MFNSSLTAQAVAMRPGLISGRYPERCERDAGFIDASFNTLRGKLAQFSVDRQRGLRKVAAAISREGDTLTGLNREQLDKRLAQLRRDFLSQGLSDALCIKSFALIRELATRTLHQRHYDVQLMGGWAILKGQLAEMETGEGKTLTATLAAATAALAGIPVHVITVNEYLVKRDAELMGDLYRALGLTVGAAIHSMTQEQRRNAYACNVTYCTNKQVAFDYLRDRLVLDNNRSQLRQQLSANDPTQSKQCLLRGLCFAIVDEADSVLIDEAITPLILTRSIESSAEHVAYRQALEIAWKFEEGEDFILNPSDRQVQLSLAGQQKLEGFELSANSVWKSARGREELVIKALRALHLLKRDRDYLVMYNKIMIVDASTGRTLPDRSWERGLHQMVELKENCPLSEAREQLGRITYQRFFSRYLRLGGMTGTAREVSSEIWAIYSLHVQRIPLHRPGKRERLPSQVFARSEEKWAAVIGVTKNMQAQGRPVLIGTASVTDSELLSRKFKDASIPHQILNARQDKREAEIVALAGRRYLVTIATNMAGRGTDIPLGKDVAELGGLHVIATSYNEAKRIDRQLFGRCARQGDPGSYQYIVSLNDELVQENCSPQLTKTICRHSHRRYPLLKRLSLRTMRKSQRRVEIRQRDARRNLMKQDRQIHRTLAFTGNME